MNLLEMTDIRKSFSGVNVLNGVRFNLKAGTVHAFMGENGAGKSTLMKILAGVHKCDSGTIKISGNKVEINSPTDSQKLGVAMIHQEMSPIPFMTVAENIFLAREPVKGLFVDYNKMYAQTQELLSNLNINISPKSKLSSLKVADQQLVEIAKAVSFNAKIIVMDEPTSAITDKEVENLFKIIRSLRENKKGIIYISHKMDEIFRIADEITVMRDGNYINTWFAKDINNEILIKNMVGRELNEIFPILPDNIGETMLSLKNLTSTGKFNNITFDVKKGEILGVAGLVGAGRTEVMNALFGLEPSDSGEIVFDGKPFSPKNPLDAISKGIGYVTEDRKGEGLILKMGVGQNITLSYLVELTKNQLIDRAKESELIKTQVNSLKIKINNSKQLASSLSGGNQQKIVLAKWLIRAPKLLILDEPTRGIDIGAKSEIYKLMCEFVSLGNSIIMISSELPEVMGMSHRIVVLSNHLIGGIIERSEFTQENIISFAVSKM